MKKLILAALFATSAAVPAHSATLVYQVTSLSGSWAWGNTQWNNVAGQGYVNNATDVGTVDGIFHAPYAYSAPGTVPGNAIYNWSGGGQSPASVIALANGGVVTTLNSLSILTSRSYSSGTVISLDVSADGGSSWTNVLSSTTGALGWIDVGTGGTATQTINLAFGGASGNAFRFTADGAQINIHSLALDGAAVQGVPEPAAWAMMLAGFGLVGSAMRRREKVAVTFA